MENKQKTNKQPAPHRDWFVCSACIVRSVYLGRADCGLNGTACGFPNGGKCQEATNHDVIMDRSSD